MIRLYFGNDAAGEEHKFESFKSVIDKLWQLWWMYEEDMDGDLYFKIIFDKYKK